MKHYLIPTVAAALVAAALVAAAALYAAEGEDAHAGHEAMAQSTVELTGEIIDIACYLRHESSGSQHGKCATYCAGLGMPFGFLEAETGHVYLLLPKGHASPTEGLLQHFGEQVKITGILVAAKGFTGLEVTTVATP